MDVNFDTNDMINHDLITPILGSQEALDGYLDSTDQHSFELEHFGPKSGIFTDITYLTKPPINDEFEVPPYNFQIELPGPSEKNNWTFSPLLKKAFIKMSKTFIVKISYTNALHAMSSVQDPLFLRIIPIFTAHEDQHLPVKRCLNHQSGTPDNKLKAYVVTCKQPPNAIYEGNAEAFSYGDRLSIRIPLNDTVGFIEHSIGLEFACQNSCTSGMNRKSTSLLFALETADRTILGRRLMPFKICSCPKRDMEKEELQVHLDSNTIVKRKSNWGNSSRPRKKLSIKREAVSPLPSATVNGHNLNMVLPNSECVKQVQEAASNAIAAYLLDNNPEDREDWENYRKTLK